MSASHVYKISFGLAVIDALMALVCAANGDAMCICFAALAGLVLAHGLYFLSKAEGEQDEL